MKKEYNIKLPDGTLVPVSEEVYRAYKQSQWRESNRRRAVKERERSLEQVEESVHITSQEKLAEQIVEDKLLLEMLHQSPLQTHLQNRVLKKQAEQQMNNTISNVWNGIVGAVKGAINGIISAINSMIRGAVFGINGLINGINKVTGAVGIPSIPTFTAPQIPMLAKGDMIRTAGSVIVGEKGPEILSLPQGAKVTPIDKSTKRTENKWIINIGSIINVGVTK